MSLKVIADASTASEDRSKAKLVVESDLDNSSGSFQGAFDELSSIKARHCAINFAATKIGMRQPTMNGNVEGPYPVNAEGVPLDLVPRKDAAGVDLPANLPQFQPARYRVDVPLCEPIL